MVIKHWISQAVIAFEECLAPVPHEINELDWKLKPSENKEHPAEHLMAFANYSDGGCMVFGMKASGELVGVEQAVGRAFAAALFRLIGGEANQVKDIAKEVDRAELLSPSREPDLERWEERVEHVNEITKIPDTQLRSHHPGARRAEQVSRQCAGRRARLS